MTTNNQASDSEFDIHQFIALGLRIGLKYSEIVEMSYIQLHNIMCAYFKKQEHKATQQEIDLIT